jgi:bifunctional non-homologous end joining protein LigD
MSATLGFSNPDKPLFPDGLTKAQLAAYYRRVAEVMLPHVRGRPVHMQRFPDGIRGPVIQQKQAPDYFPEFVRRVRVPRKRGGAVDQVVIEDVETLVYLVGQACITPHVLLSRAGHLDRPDQLIFDLDPPDSDLRPARRAARELRELLEGCGLAAYLKTTGSRGYHVVSPVDGSVDFAGAGAFAREVAGLLAERRPRDYTVQQRIADRGGRLYLDTGRNGYAQTAVAPYAVRGLDGAPVACPLDWSELGRARPDRFTVRNLFRRLARRDDPWAGMFDRPGSLRDAAAALRRA